MFHVTLLSSLASNRNIFKTNDSDLDEKQLSIHELNNCSIDFFGGK